MIAVPAALVPQVVEECGRKQGLGVVVLVSGFAETVPRGRPRGRGAASPAALGIRLVGPNCLGILNTGPGGPAPRAPSCTWPPARAACRSCRSRDGRCRHRRPRLGRGVGISSFVALGNRADVSGNDLLQYWEEDPATDVVCLYIESLGNARHFQPAGPPASHQREAGRRGEGGLAPQGRRRPTCRSPARPPTRCCCARPVCSACRRSPTSSTRRVLGCQPLPQGRRVAVVGNAGGSLAIAADAIVGAGLQLARLTEATRAGLEAARGPQRGPRGPGRPRPAGRRRELRRGPRPPRRRPRRRRRGRRVRTLARRHGRRGARRADATAAAHPAIPVVARAYGATPGPSRGGGQAGRPWCSTPSTAPHEPSAGSRSTRPGSRRSPGAPWCCPPARWPWPGRSWATRSPRDRGAGQGRGRRAAWDGRHRRGADRRGRAGRRGRGRGRAARLPGGAQGRGRATRWPRPWPRAWRSTSPMTPAVRTAWGRMQERFGEGLVPALVQPMVEPGVDVAASRSRTTRRWGP